MEKQPKPVRPGGKKRQRKVSLSETASEPKHMKLHLKDNNTKLKPTLTPEKDQENRKPKKSNVKPVSIKKIKNDPLFKAIKPMSANATIGSKKAKVEVVHALTGSRNALNGSASSIESVKVKTESTDAVIAVNQAVTAKKLKSAKLNVNPISQKIKSESILASLPKKKKKKIQEVTEETVKEEPASENSDTEEPTESAVENAQDVQNLSLEEIHNKYPILKDKEITERFLKVPLNNNQKGRIRQAIKLSLQGTSNTMFPDIINGRIQAILNSSANLTDSELRRIRILYNMLRTAVEAPNELITTPKKKKEKIKKLEKGDESGEKKDQAVVKVKGPKRYVVFLGNLPLDVDKEKIMDHFKEMNEQIKDIRIPKVAEGIKSAIAYVELSNEPSYELALSKHHSMMGNKRIKVLYSTQQNSKISRSAAKGKSAKLIAMQKSGKLVGSTPLAKKRSHRRAIMKKAKGSEATVDG